MKRALVLAVVALVLAPAASAHGDRLIREAANHLAMDDDSIYVHPDAIPKLEPDEVEELGTRMNDAGGGIVVAILPADALHEARDADTVLERIVERVGREGTYVVVVGGQFQATSTPGDLGPAEGARLARDAYRERVGLAPTLNAFVDFVRQERERRRPAPAEDDDGTNWLLVGAGVLALVGIVLLAPVLRSGSAATLRRARRRSSVG